MDININSNLKPNVVKNFDKVNFKKEKLYNTLYEKDEVIFSDSAKEVQKALHHIKNNDDVRFDLVQQFKDKIQNGLYEIDTEKISEKLLDNYLG